MFIVFRPAGPQMVWEKGIQDDQGQVPLAGPTVLLDTLPIDLKYPPGRVFTQGMDEVHHLAEVDNEVGLTQSQYCYARRAHLTPMPLLPKPKIRCQKSDSGKHHCPRYTRELTSHHCWAWLAGYWEHAQGFL